MRATIIFLLVNVIIFLAQYFTGLGNIDNSFVTNYLALTPTLAISGFVWQFFSYMWLHGGGMHLGVNMLALIIFGPMVEERLGRRKFILLYILAGLGSAFLHLAITGISNIPMLGASGAIFGILAAYGWLYPKNWVVVFPGIPMPAIIAVFAFIGIELFFGVTGLESGIANWGHLGGLFTGIIFMLWWRRGQKTEKAFPEMEFMWE